MLFLKHTDGNIWPILPQLIDADIDALCPLEPKAGMDIGEVKEKYGDQIALVGNIDVADLLPNGSREEVDASVKECISKASPGGGHILSSSNTIHYDVNPDNYLEMINALRKYGNYPIEV